MQFWLQLTPKVPSGQTSKHLNRHTNRQNDFNNQEQQQTHSVSGKSRLTLAFSSYVIARCPIVTIARLWAISTPKTERTSIRANLTDPTRFAVTFSCFLIAATAVLASAILFAFAPMFSPWTQPITSKIQKIICGGSHLFLYILFDKSVYLFNL